MKAFVFQHFSRTKSRLSQSFACTIWKIMMFIVLSQSFPRMRSKTFYPSAVFPLRFLPLRKFFFPHPCMQLLLLASTLAPFILFPKNLVLSLWKRAFYPLSFFSAPFKVGQYLKKDSSSLPNIFGTQSDLISFICMTRQKCWHQNTPYLLCCMECKKGWRIYVSLFQQIHTSPTYTR